MTKIIFCLLFLLVLHAHADLQLDKEKCTRFVKQFEEVNISIGRLDIQLRNLKEEEKSSLEFDYLAQYESLIVESSELQEILLNNCLQ